MCSRASKHHNQPDLCLEKDQMSNSVLPKRVWIRTIEFLDMMVSPWNPLHMFMLFPCLLSPRSGNRALVYVLGPTSEALLAQTEFPSPCFLL